MRKRTVKSGFNLILAGMLLGAGKEEDVRLSYVIILIVSAFAIYLFLSYMSITGKDLLFRQGPSP